MTVLFSKTSCNLSFKFNFDTLFGTEPSFAETINSINQHHAVSMDVIKSKVQSIAPYQVTLAL